MYSLIAWWLIHGNAPCKTRPSRAGASLAEPRASWISANSLSLSGARSASISSGSETPAASAAAADSSVGARAVRLALSNRFLICGSAGNGDFKSGSHLQNTRPHDALHDAGVPVKQPGRHARDDVALVHKADQSCGQLDCKAVRKVAQPHARLPVGM